MSKNKEKELVNPTQERLSGLPFKRASEMKEEQFEIQKAIWKRFEEAKYINELAGRPEYKFWQEQFRLGLACSYGRNKTDLVKIFAKEDGALQINIHEKNGKDVSSECLLEVLVRAMSESFGSIYFKVKGMLPSFHPAGADINKKDEKAI